MAARKFFYVAAGMFLLALSYHLGADSAKAQAGLVTVASEATNSNVHVAVVGRTIHFAGTDGEGALSSVTRGSLPPVPGTGAVVWANAANGTQWFVAILDNGDVYHFIDGSGWVLAGNLVSGPTPALRQSWGQLKARYAPKSAPVLQAPTNK